MKYPAKWHQRKISSSAGGGARIEETASAAEWRKIMAAESLGVSVEAAASAWRLAAAWLAMAMAYENESAKN